MTLTELPEPTPEYKTKPMLVYICKLMGMDLYVDISGQKNPESKRQVAEDVMKKIFTQYDKK